MNNKIILIVGICMLVLLSGCSNNLTPWYKQYTYPDTNSTVQNNQKCFELCKQREVDDSYHNGKGRYVCEYEPVICDNGICLCVTK